MARLSYGFVCASLTRDLKASYDVKKRATYLAGTWQGSSSLLLQCRAAHCTLRPVKHWEAPMGSVHSKISGSASSRPRGWQHYAYSPYPQKRSMSAYYAGSKPAFHGPALWGERGRCGRYAIMLGRSPRKIARMTLRSTRRELD